MGGRTKTSGQGRPKGTPNKVTAQLKDMILQALDEAGGVQYLKDRAQDTPVAFMALVGKVLPLQVTTPDQGGIHVIIGGYKDAG